MTSQPLAAAQLAELRQLVWPPQATPGDIDRWHKQGFAWSTEVAFGLRQAHGGPCGVLASIQAEIIRQVLFVEKTDLFRVSVAQRDDTLMSAMAALLWKTSTQGRVVVVTCCGGCCSIDSPAGMPPPAPLSAHLRSPPRPPNLHRLRSQATSRRTPFTTSRPRVRSSTSTRRSSTETPA
jgi:hypothetical protein